MCAAARLFTLGSMILLAVSSATPAQVSTNQPAGSVTRFYLHDGRTLDASGYVVSPNRTVLTLAHGEMMVVQSDQVIRMETISQAVPAAAPLESPPAALLTARAAGRDAAVLPDRSVSAVAAPPAAESIESVIRSAAAKYHLEVDLLAAVIAVESGYRADAVSARGAQGLMQLMPGTARDLNVSDALDPRQNIDAGARYLRQLLDQNGDKYWKALAAYNAGMGRVARHKGLPPYRETIDYIQRVLNLYQSPRPMPRSVGMNPLDAAARPAQK